MEKRGRVKGVPTEREVDKEIIEDMYKEGYLYIPYGIYARRTHGCKIFKPPLDGSFTCPNWDGRLSNQGCVFCPNLARQFTYESFRRVISESVENQVKDQVKYYQGVGAGDKALVYIAFGTNTYKPLSELRKLYETALKQKDVIGLSIGTRPDCVPPKVLDLLGEYVKEGYEIWLELGQQSVHYHTEEEMNRQHGLAETIKVVKEAHKRGILCLAFLIFGFSETPAEIRETARVISEIGVDAVKLYPLLVMRDTKLQREYEQGNYRPISSIEYSLLMADFLENLSPHILIQRISKDCGLDGKVAPKWDTHRWIIGPRVEKILKMRNSRQGAKYQIGLTVEELEPLKK